MAASGVEAAFRMLEGRWKVVIIFHLFDQTMLRFSELERAILGVLQKMLIQQLRELERDSIVERTIYPQVPNTVWPIGAGQCAPPWTLCSNGLRRARRRSDPTNEPGLRARAAPRCSSLRHRHACLFARI